jgi:hypothetical protein
MRLPAGDASVDEWETFLGQCRTNPGLDPAKGPCPPLISRPTGLVIDADPKGGVQMKLLEYTAQGPKLLAEGHVRGRAAS